MPARKPFSTPLRRFGLVFSTAVVLAVAACTAPSTSNGTAPADATADTRSATTGQSSADSAEASASTPVQTPPRPPQLPPVERPSPRPSLGQDSGNAGQVPAGGTVEIDRSCSSDAQCTVKDVGNCCGYYPACVNVDSPTDPEGVQAQCAKTGMASVCGFPAISSCQCVAGQCEGSSQALLE